MDAACELCCPFSALTPLTLCHASGRRFRGYVAVSMEKIKIPARRSMASYSDEVQSVAGFVCLQRQKPVASMSSLCCFPFQAWACPTTLQSLMASWTGVRSVIRFAYGVPVTRPVTLVTVAGQGHQQRHRQRRRHTHTRGIKASVSAAYLVPSGFPRQRDLAIQASWYHQRLDNSSSMQGPSVPSACSMPASREGAASGKRRAIMLCHKRVHRLIDARWLQGVTRLWRSGSGVCERMADCRQHAATCIVRGRQRAAKGQERNLCDRPALDTLTHVP